METQNEVLDSISVAKNDAHPETTISLPIFVLLSIATFGIYEVWWMYKEWRFFKRRENSDIMPAGRAIFSIFFLYSLFSRILNYAKEKNYDKSYSPGWLFFGFIVVQLLGRLPEPYWLVSFLSIAIFIPPLQASNYAKQNTAELNVTEQNSFNGRQIVLLVVGGIFWLLVLIGLGAVNY